MTIDESVIEWAVDQRTPLLDDAMRAFTVIGNQLTLLAVVVIVAVGLWRSGRLPTAAIFLAGSASAWAVMLVLKQVFRRDRPQEPEPLLELTTYSFPSGHALVPAAVYLLAVFLLGRVLQWSTVARTLVLFAAIIAIGLSGISRVYLGVHHPSDVLAGWLIGTAIAALFLRLERRAAPHG